MTVVLDTISSSHQTIIYYDVIGAYAKLFETDFLAEINLMLSIGRHEHVVAVLGVSSDVTIGNPVMVMEYAEHGDLLHLLHNSRDVRF